MKMRIRFRFSIGVLLIAVTSFCIWLGIEARRVHDQRTAIAAIEKVEGTYQFGFQERHWELVLQSAYGSAAPPPPTDPGPAWLRQWLGDDFFRYITRVSLDSTWANDELIKNITRLPRLQNLNLGRNEDIEDDSLVHLQQLRSLNTLGLPVTNVTDNGLRHVAELRNLTTLFLSSTAITDQGMAHLSKLRNLEELWVNDTAVGDLGMKHISALPRLRRLSIETTKVTDAGLKHLAKASGLEVLMIDSKKYVTSVRTPVSREGISWLESKLPQCRVNDRTVD